MNKIARSTKGTNVLSVQFAHERAWQTRGLQSANKRRLLKRLESENAQLRGSLVNLMLQIRELREAPGCRKADRFPSDAQ